jgi:hypothetical protein
MLMGRRGSRAAMARPTVSFNVPEPPPGFAIDRSLTSAHHPILRVFPGLDALPTAEHLQPDSVERAALFGKTEIALVDEDVWMYVAPRESSLLRSSRWKPVIAPDLDCIVVGRDHLRESPGFTLFMDIFHELRHVLQRQAGAQLFGGFKRYVEKPTEIDAYRFVVEEARGMGATDDFLRDYLRVDWIDEKEFLELLSAVGVSPP